MKNNQLATKVKKFRDVKDILRDPSKAAKLQNYIDEAVRCKTKILDENESIKTLRQSAAEEVEIEPKMFNVLVSLMFNNNFDQKKEEFEKLIDMVDAIMTAHGIAN